MHKEEAEAKKKVVVVLRRCIVQSLRHREVLEFPRRAFELVLLKCTTNFSSTKVFVAVQDVYNHSVKEHRCLIWSMERT